MPPDPVVSRWQHLGGRCSGVGPWLNTFANRVMSQKLGDALMQRAFEGRLQSFSEESLSSPRGVVEVAACEERLACGKCKHIMLLHSNVICQRTPASQISESLTMLVKECMSGCAKVTAWTTTWIERRAAGDALIWEGLCSYRTSSATGFGLGRDV